jgi:hypothetical protein
VGASWEGYAVEEVLKAIRPDEAYYWPPITAPNSTCSCSREDAGSAWNANALMLPR